MARRTLALSWLFLLSHLSTNAQSVLFSVPHGLFAAPFDITLRPTNTLATVYFTLDGSVPNDGSDGQPIRGLPYSAPLLIGQSQVVRARAFTRTGVPSETVTRTYLFASSFLSQPTDPPGFPPTWGFFNADYAMDLRIVTNAVYRTHFLDDLRRLPWISLVAEVEDLFGTNGIYSNSEQHGSIWERPVSMELFDPMQPDSGFQANAGIQILGESSRSALNPKHSFRVQFKTRYGPSKLNYPIMPGSPVTVFDTVDLLASSIDSVSMNFLDSGLATPLYLRDAFLKQSQLDLGRPGVHTGYSHLFVNGLYWGLYRLSERPDAGYASTYFGGKKSDYDVLKHLDFGSLEVVDGDRVAWDAMYAIAAGGLKDATQYAAIQQYLDVEAFADYLIVNMHLGNGDWPQKNWYAVHKRAAGEGFRFFCWDGDGVLGLFGITLDKTGFATPNTPAFLYSQLRSNLEFRVLFGDRVQRLILEDGGLAVSDCQARLRRIAEGVQSGIVGESARWGDSYFRKPGQGLFTLNDYWLPELDRVLNQTLPQRHLISLEQFRAAGLYAVLGPPEFSIRPGLLDPGVMLSLGHTNGEGAIYFTLDGTDPRRSGGQVATGALEYQSALNLDAPSLLRARVKRGVDWSAMMEGIFVPGPAPRFSGLQSQPNGVHLRWEGRTGFRYQVESTDALASGIWEVLATVGPLTVATEIDWIDVRTLSTERYYRLVPVP